MAASLTHDRPDRSDVLERIGVPTLLFVGSEDALRPEVEQAAARIAGSRLLQVTGFDHMALALHMVEVLPAVHTFLRGVAARATARAAAARRT
jgi:pimeloyl-ACP methyl ester carboxylesterase